MRAQWSSKASVVLLLLTTTACKKLTAKGEATIEEEDGVEVVTVEVVTEPKAKVFLLDGPVSATKSKIEYAGENASNWVIADEKGKATLRLPIWTGEEEEKDLELAVWRGKDLPFRKTPRFDFTVSATRPASIRVNEGKVTCIAKKCEGIVRKDLALVLSEIEDGTKVAMAGGPVVVAANKQAEAPPDFQKLFASEDIDAVFGTATGQVTLPMSLEFKDGTKVKRNVLVPKSGLRDALAAKMKSPEKGPTLLPGEAPDARGTGALLNVSRALLFGKAHKPTDIDFVAVQTEEKRTKPCGRYRGDDGGVSTLDLEVTDASIAIYERRTGKRRLRKTFQAAAPCPETYVTYDKNLGADTQAHRFDQKAADDFLADFVLNPAAARGDIGGGGGRGFIGGRLF